MIQSVKDAIVSKLSELYAMYKIYDEVMPQDYVKPSFLISLTNQKYTKRINFRTNVLLSFDVAYFSNFVTDAKNDCINVQSNLLNEFHVIGAYRTQNKQVKITDNVMHFSFDVNYSQLKVVSSTKMQEPKINIRMED